MTSTETPVVISQVEQVLAENGYEVAELGDDVLRVRDVETGIAFRAALEETVPATRITPELMRRMLAADNGISTSSFKLYDAGEGRTSVALTNFCTLQNMGAEDKDDVLSLASYLMADLLEARDVIEGPAGA
jgi:hypothetical protein